MWRQGDWITISASVNCVAPGYTTTDMVAVVPEKVIERVVATIPLKRFGRPEEVARAVHFLCADASAYVTGRLWAVNGGIEM